MRRLANGLRYATVVFDVDSTLAALEGIDWLAEQRSPEVARACTDLTARAMAGEMPLEDVYLWRVQAIAPTAAEIGALSDAYREAVQPGAVELIAALRDAGCAVHVLSGGLRAALLPLAHDLGVPSDQVHAVTLATDASGRYVALDGDQPLATQLGKAKVLASLQLERPVVMIGDGSTDAAARGVTEGFIAYTGVARRPSVVAVADAEASSFAALALLLFKVMP
ncbi:MAG: HAD-IB family phosphatase [Gemmatimonadaceae bacterium]|nr:HAD-IB family phosphatase [Gemmatimonadaceae bacterium]